jgi:cysteine desulfurase family protein
MIYLDNAATSYPKPASTYKNIGEWIQEFGANPGRSGHQFGLKTNRAIYETRESLNRFFKGDNPLHFVFTANATDSINLVILGLLGPGDHVVASETEHNAVLRPLELAKARGVTVTLVPVDDQGIVDPDAMSRAIREETKLVVCTHASNVTGAIQPIEAIAEKAKSRDCLFLVDAAQSAGILPIDLSKTAIDFLAITGHKSLYGIQGAGALYIRQPDTLPIVRAGGTGSRSQDLNQPDVMPDKYETGTLNTPGILGLKAGIAYVEGQGLDSLYKRAFDLGQALMAGLLEIPEVKVYGPALGRDRVPVVSFNLGDLDSAEVSYMLDQTYGIITRGGLHCAPLIHRKLGTLNQGAVRASLGIGTTKEDIQALIEAIAQIAKQL